MYSQIKQSHDPLIGAHQLPNNKTKCFEWKNKLFIFFSSVFSQGRRRLPELSPDHYLVVVSASAPPLSYSSEPLGLFGIS